MKKDKELLFSVKKEDCTFKFYKGSGKGGQKRNKTENCCQCTHNESGAQASSEQGRSKEQNIKNAFKKMTETDTFKQWIQLEIYRKNGKLEEIKQKVANEMKKITVEIKKDGKWTKES